MVMPACRHSPLSGSHDLENWATAATESVVGAYRCVLALVLLTCACYGEEMLSDFTGIAAC